MAVKDVLNYFLLCDWPMDCCDDDYLHILGLGSILTFLRYIDIFSNKL